MNDQLQKWKKIGQKRRAGIICPLFYIWSKKSIGIGEIPDLKLLIDWCKKVGFSILQLLPLNDSGFNFSPYSLQSSFALDPIYLSLRDLVAIRKENLDKELELLKKEFPTNTRRVNYKIKKAKLEKLWEIFLKRANLDSPKFKNFKIKNSHWLENYSLYRVLKAHHKERSWENWKKDFKQRNLMAIKKFKESQRKEIEFQKWLQWQLFEQLRSIKEYAQKKGVLLKGDFLWLISRDSADVWANPQYFDLDFSAGAPPDAFSKKGQRWGFPPLNWKRVFEDGFIYFKQRLKYLENFYDLLRIDHAVGLFRMWKIPISEPLKNKGKNGFFDPKDENLCEKQGWKILSEMIKNTKILLCAEDLGTIPSCCPKVLKELGIPGIKVQRWNKDWKTSEFINPRNYPFLSVATLSTHDTSNFLTWWEKEATKKERENLLRIIFKRKEKLKVKRRDLIFKNLETINSSNSIFCILLIFEWLFLNDLLDIKEPWQYRFNTPGTISKKNWSLRMPISLEDLLDHPITNQIRKILQKTQRIP